MFQVSYFFLSPCSGKMYMYSICECEVNMACTWHLNLCLFQFPGQGSRCLTWADRIIHLYVHELLVLYEQTRRQGCTSWPVPAADWTPTFFSHSPPPALSWMTPRIWRGPQSVCPASLPPWPASPSSPDPQYTATHNKMMNFETTLQM